MDGPAATASRGADAAVRSDEPVAVRLLGPVQAVVAGEPVAVGSPKLRRLFTVLALNPNRVVSTARLVDELWGEDTPESATAALQVYVSRLRRALGDASDGAGQVRLARRAPGYLLAVPEDAVDVRRFARLVEAARQQLPLDAGRALALLDEALALVRGEPLADVVDELDPLAADAQQLREMVLSAEELRVEALLELGRARPAALATGRLVAAHPYRESVHALHLLALYRSGRTADALAAYEELRQRLADELGADPGPQLRRLHAHVLQHDPALAGPPDPDPGVPVVDRVPEEPPTSVLVGRQAVVDRVEQALAQLVAGHGGVWTLSGEAGIGKTRLAEELSRRALARDLTVVWGRGEEGAGDAPYRPWGQVLRALPDVAAAGPAGVLLGEEPSPAGHPDPAARLHLHDAVAAALVGHADRPLVVVLEDVQWFDELSLELLLAVARLVPTAPLLLALTLRQDARSPAAVRQLSARLARLPASHQVRVSALSAAEAADLVAVRAGLPPGPRPAWVAWTVQRGEGNPFFLTELTRLVLDQPAGIDGGAPSGLPLGLRDVLLDRLDRLSPDGRELLDLASVVGRETPYGLLEQVLGWSPDRLDAALVEVADAGLVTETLLPELTVRFSHALVQELLVGEQRPTVLARRHVQVGTALAALPGRVDSDRVLAHLGAGASTAPVPVLLGALLDAARRASGQTAYEHAQRLLRRALDLAEQLPEGPERDTVELRVQARLGSAIAGQHGWAAPAAEAALARAHALARRAEPDAETFGAIYHHLSFLVVAADFPRTTALAEELLGRAGSAPPELAPVYELLGRIGRGLVLWHRGADADAVVELGRAHELAGSVVTAELAEVFSHDPAIPVLSLLAHALVGAGRVDEGLAASREALVLARQTRPPETAAALMAATLLAAGRRETERTRELAAELLALGRTHDLAMYVVLASIPLGWAGTLLAEDEEGREEALAALRQAHDLYARSGAGTFTPLMAVLRSEAELAAGHPAAAREAAAAGVRAAEQHDVRLWWDRLSALAAG